MIDLIKELKDKQEELAKEQAILAANIENLRRNNPSKEEMSLSEAMYIANTSLYKSPFTHGKREHACRMVVAELKKYVDIRVVKHPREMSLSYVQSVVENGNRFPTAKERHDACYVLNNALKSADIALTKMDGVLRDYKEQQA